MRRDLPSLNGLRAFEAAARLGGFAAAALELGVTPGAVSRHVKLLEKRAGVVLFERRARSLCLTQRGQDLLAVVGEIFDRLEAGVRAALSPASRTRLLVNVQTSLAIGWLLPRLDRFHREQTELELEISNHIETPDVRAGEVDAAITHGRGPWTGVAAQFLFADRMMPVCSPRYLASRGIDIISAARLPTETLIVSNTAVDDWADWFGHSGLHGARPRRTVNFASSLLPLHAALNGLGVALVDLALVGEHIEAGRLICVTGIAPLTRGTGYYLIHASGRDKELGLAALRRWLSAEVSKTRRDTPPVAGPQAALQDRLLTGHSREASLTVRSTEGLVDTHEASPRQREADPRRSSD